MNETSEETTQRIKAINNMNKQEQAMEERFYEGHKKLFTKENGLSVLLDYPPHEMVLDEGSVVDFIKQEIALAVQQERERVLKEFCLKVNDEWLKCSCTDELHTIINKNL